MKDKGKLPHVITVITFVVFIVLGLACASSPKQSDSQSGSQSDSQKQLRSASDYIKRAYTNSTNGNYDLAIEDYTEAIRIEPKNATAYNGRAWVYAYYLKTNYDQALADADQALKLSPNNASYLDTRGWVYLGMGNHNKATDDFLKALQINPKIESSQEGLKQIREAQAEEVIDWSEFE